ncbi:MAG: hypothetical protein GXP40_08365 [Chloroflexi bacterium]|nr:hypothetical protein [Chloroflexota bacterium]
MTGAHARTSCTQCHSSGNFQNVSTSCVACHGQPSYHAGLFGSNCASCHNTSSWGGAVYNGSHSFNIYHEGAGGNCSTCHPSTLNAYTCLACHDSNNPKDDDGGGDGDDD